MSVITYTCLLRQQQGASTIRVCRALPCYIFVSSFDLHGHVKSSSNMAFWHIACLTYISILSRSTGTSNNLLLVDCGFSAIVVNDPGSILVQQIKRHCRLLFT
jgi:hypothetical protein